MPQLFLDYYLLFLDIDMIVFFQFVPFIISLYMILFWAVKRIWKCYIEFALYKYILLLLL